MGVDVRILPSSHPSHHNGQQHGLRNPPKWHGMPNIAQSSRKNFRVLGVMLATIIARGGQPPAIFAKPVVDAILGKDPSLSVDFLPSLQIHRSLEQVSGARDDNELQEALEDCKWRFDLDGLPSVISMDNKDTFVQLAINYFLILQTQPMLDQLIEGLKHCQILSLLRKHQLRDVLQFNECRRLTAELVSAMFTPVFTSLERRQKEEDTVAIFNHFLEAVEAGNLCTSILQNEDLTDEETEFGASLTLKAILAFVTGSDSEPVGGFQPPPTLSFFQGHTTRLPSVSTCSNQLCVSSVGRTGEAKFVHNLLTAMMNSHDFNRA